MQNRKQALFAQEIAARVEAIRERDHAQARLLEVSAQLGDAKKHLKAQGEALRLAVGWIAARGTDSAFTTGLSVSLQDARAFLESLETETPND